MGMNQLVTQNMGHLGLVRGLGTGLGKTHSPNIHQTLDGSVVQGFCLSLPAQLSWATSCSHFKQAVQGSPRQLGQQKGWVKMPLGGTSPPYLTFWLCSPALKQHRVKPEG
ncbi:UNVERIFIED_CONTAM: hypothetical protein K2H54_055514 [Gekko kuhli]